MSKGKKKHPIVTGEGNIWSVESHQSFVGASARAFHFQRFREADGVRERFDR